MVADRVVAALTFGQRLRGWIGRLPARDEGLWLPRCGYIHTCGLRVAIDAIWCGRDGVILRVDRSLRPWRIAAAPGAAGVCELSEHHAAVLAPGDHLDLVVEPFRCNETLL